MALAGKKRKGDFLLPDWVAKSLECPVCPETIKDPPIFQCEKGHGLCQTCREPLKAQNKPCPVCRGKLVDTRCLALENMLEQLPKIKCKYEGCTFGRSNDELLSEERGRSNVKHDKRPLLCQSCGVIYRPNMVNNLLITNILERIRVLSILHSDGMDIAL